MPGPIVSRPLLRNLALTITTLAAVTITGLMTFSAGSTFKFSDQGANRIIFLDQNQKATTSQMLTFTTSTGGAIVMSGTGTSTFAGPVSSTMLFTGSAYVSSTIGSSLPSLTVTGTTKFADASSTFFLSGASALISTTAPIPTSTAFMAGTIPNQLYLFNATNTNCVYWTPGQLRGSWVGGSVVPRVSWIPATTGTGAVVWRFAAQSLADGSNVWDAFTGPYAFATSTIGNNLVRQIEAMDTLTVQGEASGVPIRFEACRIGGQTGDTFGGDAYLEVIAGEYLTPSYSD